MKNSEQRAFKKISAPIVADLFTALFSRKQCLGVSDRYECKCYEQVVKPKIKNPHYVANSSSEAFEIRSQ